MNDLLENIENIEEPDLDELSNEKVSLEKWRGLIWKYKRELQRLEDINALKQNIIAKYDAAIDNQKCDIGKFKRYLQHFLLLADEHKTKTGGYALDIPDMGKFGCTKPKQKLEITDDYYYELPQLQETKTEFSKTKFNEFIEDKCTITNMGVVDKLTGEILQGLEVKEQRSWTFPKLEEN